MYYGAYKPGYEWYKDQGPAPIYQQQSRSLHDLTAIRQPPGYSEALKQQEVGRGNFFKGFCNTNSFHNSRIPPVRLQVFLQ